MKKIFSIIAISMIFFIMLSCKKNSSSIIRDNNTIAKKWVVLTQGNYQNNGIITMRPEEFKEFSENKTKEVFEIRNDGNLIYSIFDSNNLKLSEEGIWEYSTDKKSVSIKNCRTISGMYEIVDFSENILRLKQTMIICYQ